MDVAAALTECGQQQGGLATAAQLRSQGVTRSTLSRALHRGLVVRVRPAVYAAGPLEPWPVHAVTHLGVSPAYVQLVRAVLLSLGPGATATGATAACLRGWGLLHEPLRTVDVTVAAGRSRVRLAGVRTLQRTRVPRVALVVLPGSAPIWTTTAVTTVLDCCRRMKLLDAVVVCDSALRSGQVTLSELQVAAARMRGLRHARRVRRMLALCDPEAGSVLESVARVRLVEGGVSGFATQRVLRSADGKRILRVDFCFERQRLVVETDGTRWHPDPNRDRTLDNRLAAAGWRVLRFTWSEVVHDWNAVLTLVHAALEAGSGDFRVGAVDERWAA